MALIKILITDTCRFDPFEMARALPKGSIVILRDYDLPDSKREDLARRLRNFTKRKNLIFLVGKTPKLAKKVSADGVHLPEFMAKTARALRQKHPQWLISCASHNFWTSVKAKNSGASIILISPIFKTSSHPEKTPLGIYKAEKLAINGIFCAVLGGVDKKNTKKINPDVFQGVAGISWGKKRGN